MTTYIALLRGINVSGHNIIKMVDLKILLVGFGLKNVVTYIQSGNIIFQSDILNKIELETKINQGIKKKYDFNIPVLILTKTEIDTIFSSNPFLKRKEIELHKLHITVLNELPEKEGIPLLHNYCKNEEEFSILDKTIYFYAPNGVGQSKFTINVIESKLKTKATSRNWKTITKLVELSNS